MYEGCPAEYSQGLDVLVEKGHAGYSEKRVCGWEGERGRERGEREGGREGRRKGEREERWVDGIAFSMYRA